MTAQVSRRTLFAFLGPAVFALLIVGIVPLGFAVWKSFHYFNLTKLAQQRFVGIDNYTFVLTDPVFWQAMGRTALLFILSVPVQIAIGLTIALVIWDIWQWTPFVALILLAGLSTVPPEIEEAAELETKSPWIVLRHIQ